MRCNKQITRLILYVSAVIVGESVYSRAHDCDSAVLYGKVTEIHVVLWFNKQFALCGGGLWYNYTSKIGPSPPPTHTHTHLFVISVPIPSLSNVWQWIRYSNEVRINTIKGWCARWEQWLGYGVNLAGARGFSLLQASLVHEVQKMCGEVTRSVLCML